MTNYEFLLKAYRAAISSYLSCQKIESPISFLRNLIGTLDALARECKVVPGDFDNTGIHVLISTGKMYWLLTSDENSIIFGSGGGYTPLPELPEDAISALPVLSEEKQTELFPSSIKDYLRLYVIPTQSNVEREVVLGCGEKERHSVLEYLRSQEPGSSMPGNPLKQYLPLKYLDRKVMVISFPSSLSRADDTLPGDVPLALAGASHRSIPTIALYLVLVVIVCIAAIWGVSRLTSHEGQAGPPMQAGMETSPLAVAGDQLSEPAAEQVSTTPDAAARVEIAPVWHRTFSNGVTSSPVIAGNRVIFGCRDGHVYALDSQSGDIKWDYNSRAGVGASPVLADEMVLCANYNGDVFCLNKNDGSRIWNRRLPGKISSSPCVAGKRVIVGCYDTFVYCLSIESGEIAWKFDTGGIIRSTPAANGSLVMIASYDGYLYALSPADGSSPWRYRVGGNIDSSPVLSGTEVYIGGPDGTIHAIAADSGTKLWTVKAGGPVKSALAANAAFLFAGSNDGALYCIDRKTGAIGWKFATGDIILARPQVANNVVFVASYDGTVYIISTGTGEMVDSFATGKQIYCSPRIDSDRIYFGNNAGSFFCLRYLQKTAS